MDLRPTGNAFQGTVGKSPQQEDAIGVVGLWGIGESKGMPYN